VAGPFTDAFPKARAAGDATITVDWRDTQPILDTPECVDSCNGWEFDLLIKTPSGGVIDPVFNRGDLSASPFVANLRDSSNDLEALESAVIGSSASNGVYKVVVDKWPPITGATWNPSWTGSLASAQVYNGAATLGGGLKAPPPTCGTTEYWYVGDLTKSGASYTWTDKNVCQATLP
jgi:hypothetical protein